jgi:alkanesulfonate monooxygenase SsuD/methylene tetrahydromethanopterin reductase-like flavin-dependent oxidoreductase (luciferase family)
MLIYAVVGAPDTVRDGLRKFIELTGADEVMIAGQIYDHAARLRSYEIVAEVMQSL